MKILSRKALAAKTKSFNLVNPGVSTTAANDAVYDPTEDVSFSSMYKMMYTGEQLDSLTRSAQDLNYFIETFVKIRHPVRGSIPMILNRAQKGLLQAAQEHKNLLVRKPRQAGGTSGMLAFILWYSMFTPWSHSLLVFPTHAAAREAKVTFDEMYGRLPTWLRAETKYQNKHLSEFGNGSRVSFDSARARAGRGHSISLLYIDELSCVNRNVQEEMWLNLMPAVPAAGKMVVCSTVGPSADLFSTLWETTELQQQEQQASVFELHKISYWDTYIASEEHHQQMINLLGEDRFNREYLCEEPAA